MTTEPDPREAAHRLGLELAPRLPPDRRARLAARLVQSNAGWAGGQAARAEIRALLPGDGRAAIGADVVRSRTHWRFFLCGLAGLLLS